MSEPEVLYRLAPSASVPDDAWRTRHGWTTAFTGDAAESSSFIKLWTEDQLAGAAAAGFTGKADIMLMSFTVELMREEADLKVKFEAAEAAPGGSGAFAHVYDGAIPYACLYTAPVLLAVGADGKHVFPLLGAAAAAAMPGGAGYSEEKADEDSDSDGDGLEPFNQSMFDEDD